MVWIYEHKEWPVFTWELEKVATLLADVRYRQGLLLGRMEGLGFDLRRQASIKILTSDVIKSSEIEGEMLDSEEVSSSISRRLGIEQGGFVPASRDVEGIVDMMLDATQNCNDPLTEDRIFGWHSALFPSGRSGMQGIRVGAWRTPDEGPMRVVSGPFGKQTIHFEAPSAECLSREVCAFLNWFELEDDVDPILRAGIAHFWFITIHPFEDGNGRVSRAISDMALARADGISDRFYSLSTQIEAERSEYYRQLEKQQRSTPDITEWLRWFLDCLGRSIARSEDILSSVFLKHRVWVKLNQYPAHERQRMIINWMLDENFQGYMNTSKYAMFVKCSTDTALRDIQSLKEWGIFIQNDSGGRSTSYRIFDEEDNG